MVEQLTIKALQLLYTCNSIWDSIKDYDNLDNKIMYKKLLSTR